MVEPMGGKRLYNTEGLLYWYIEHTYLPDGRDTRWNANVGDLLAEKIKHRADTKKSGSLEPITTPELLARAGRLIRNFDKRRF